MRRIAAIAGLLAAVTLAVFGQGASGDGDEYEVRAIFDNGGFLVPGEEVRVAGAKVGSVSSVDVTMPGEPAHSDGSDDPGKAVVVMKIDDPGFQDFREDADCIIRPQSLLGEKYVDCTPTESRAPGSEAPPPLEEIPEDQPGAGQHLLPVESTTKAVDIDLINNIMREPYADRFRLILNDLGAGFAARGEDLQAIIRRADPALRQTNRVLAELAGQNRRLAQLAADSDTILGPFARERRAVAGFINNANVAAEATAERSQDLEAGFQRFPAALRELRLTMGKLRGFSDQATPVFAQFREGGPAIARATRALGPFANAAEPSLTSLGTAAQQSQQPLVNSDPILRDARDLARKAGPGANRLARLLANLRETGFHKHLMSLLFNTTNAINGYDQYGHFLRAWLLPNSACTFLSENRLDFCLGHWGDFSQESASSAAKASAVPSKEVRALAKLVQTDPAAYREYLDGLRAQAAGQAASATDAQAGGSAAGGTGVPFDAQGDPAGGGAEPLTGESSGKGPGGQSFRAARALLDTVLGPLQSRSANRGGRR
jgi:phospholipid/cholesterol/gamma-HCH transport system substrate-binding protein